MPMDVRRFGVGHRRPQGPEGTRGVEGAVIHSDARGAISELAFIAGATWEPHQSPNEAWLCVIEGGGWVLVGEEAHRLAAGEVARFPAGEIHAAWTDQVPMRAILVELTGPDDAWARGILEGRACVLGPGEARPAARAVGRLAPRVIDRGERDRAGEPS
jgi:quercetin dioxygenase-like cupin family protein